jgi:hypothetical protein
MATVPTKCCSSGNRCFIEPCKSSDIRNQIFGFEDEILLLDNNRPTAYKEAMMRLDSVRWQDAIKFRYIIHNQNQVLELARSSRRHEVFLDEDEYVNIRGCNVHIRLVRKIVLKTKFKELTMTRLDLS